MKERNPVEYFDQNSPEYSIERFEYASEFIKSNIQPDSSLVDVGCGTGNILHFIISRTALKDVYGIDFTPSYVEIAKNKIGSNILLGSILDSTFVDSIGKKFDFVLLGAVLHHLIGKTRKQSKYNAALALKNGYKLLKRNGFLIVIEPTFSPSLAMDALFYLKRFVSRFTANRINIFSEWNNIGEPVVSYYTNEELQAMITQENMYKVYQKEIKDLKVHPILRFAGITRRSDTTIVAQKR
jgi:SAM-dependent methyltransferase